MSVKPLLQPDHCQICGKDASEVDLVPASFVRPAVLDFITDAYPNWSDEGSICTTDLNKFRYNYLRSILEKEKGELSTLEKGVIESLAELEIRHLHQKIDHLLMRQWERLVEIQELQFELMEEIRDRSLSSRDS